MNHYRYWKIVLDFILSFFLIIVLMPFLIFLFVVVSIDIRSNAIFCQRRVGQYSKLFTIYKFKTIDEKSRRISYIGSLLRKYKFDELPQLFNIIKGDMSFVGPRPDIEGYYDKLQGDDREVLHLKPGLTSEASIKYSNEETLLSSQENPLLYNDEVIFPDKVKMNLFYLKNMSFIEDLKVIMKTIFKIIN